MTITRARKITRQFAHNFVATMRPEEAAEYKSVVDDAIEWAKANEPSLFYGIVHDYLNFLDRHAEHHICSTCKHWEPFTGACCGASYWLLGLPVLCLIRLQVLQRRPDLSGILRVYYHTG